MISVILLDIFKVVRAVRVITLVAVSVAMAVSMSMRVWPVMTVAV